MLALRAAANAKQLVEDGAGLAVVRAMEAHPKAKQIQVGHLVIPAGLLSILVTNLQR